MDTLFGKVAIVTGGSAGIGRATAIALAERGVKVVISDVDVDRGQQLAAELRDKGYEATFARADVSVDAEVASLVQRAVDEFGGLDLAFNNAGIEGTQAPTHECAPENWERTIAVNLTGVWLCMRHEIPRLLERGGGSIVNCASVAGLVGFAGAGAHSASKHGVVGLTKAAALDYAQTGIRVNAVCPGVIDTEMVRRFTGDDPAAAAAITAIEPVGRMGTADEVADAVLWLLSDQASFVTGQAVAVDGGLTTG